MTFLSIPVLSIPVSVSAVTGIGTLPWYNPSQFPVIPPNPIPAPLQKNYTWSVTMSVTTQNQSSYLTRQPGKYNGQDIQVGQWIANLSTGTAWQIISITSKTTTQVVAVVQDIYRYNTFRDPSITGNGGPGTGNYVVFNLDDEGLPQIDPAPSSGVSSTFFSNLQSRFQYINLQYNYPLYQASNSFTVGDAVAASSITHNFVLADSTDRVVIGRVTSVSTDQPGWFTINPVQKIVDFLNYLPGNVGDIIYTSLTIPGALTTVPGGSQVYVKLRNDTSSVSYSTVASPPASTTAGNVFQLNGVNVTVGGTGTIDDVVAAVNLQSSSTGVSALKVLTPTSISTNPSFLSTLYGQPLLSTTPTPAVANIFANGNPPVSVTFNISSTTPGYTNYSRAADMATAINNANIPSITASSPNLSTLTITNSAGTSITLVNVSPDSNGIQFAGPNSGSGCILGVPASTTYRIQFTAIDARPIDFLDVVGHTTTDFGLVSVENGIKAAGLYIQEGLRSASTTVVTNIAALDALSPLIGDQAYVIDSNDGHGNNVGEWSMWLYDGTDWVETSNQSSATTDAKSLEYTLTTASPSLINIGTISTGRRVGLITVEVNTPFDHSPTLTLGYNITAAALSVPAGLMDTTQIDLTTVGTYTATSDTLFGTDTPTGDVTITATFAIGTSTMGSAQIIVSYV
jgi:hypothetical protein